MLSRKRVFISHSSRDVAKANQLVAALELRNVDCWIAPRDIQSGEKYSKEILRGIMDCDAMLVMISADSLASNAVESEVENAFNVGKALYPVRLTNIDIMGGLKFFLSPRHREDFFGTSLEEVYDKLAHAITTGTSPHTEKKLGQLLR